MVDEVARDRSRPDATADADASRPLAWARPDVIRRVTGRVGRRVVEQHAPLAPLLAPQLRLTTTQLEMHRVGRQLQPGRGADEACRARVRALAAQGVNELSIVPLGPDLAAVTRTFATEVLARL